MSFTVLAIGLGVTFIMVVAASCMLWSIMCPAGAFDTVTISEPGDVREDEHASSFAASESVSALLNAPDEDDLDEQAEPSYPPHIQDNVVDLTQWRARRSG